MNLPLVQTFSKVFEQPFYVISGESKKDNVKSLISEEYNNSDNVLIKAYTNDYRTTPVENKIRNFTNSN